MATTKKKIIPIEVRDEYILGSGVSIGAVGSFDSMVLRVKFDDSWIGLNKYATWTDAQGNSGQQTQLSPFELVDGEAHTYDVSVPQLPLTYAGSVRLSFTGYAMTADGASIDRIMNTATGTFIVLESNAMRLVDGNLDASLGEQLKAIADKCAGIAAYAEDKMEAFEDAEDTRDYYESQRLKNEGGRTSAEEQRQINEFGALGNYYDESEGVVNSEGEVVSNADGGRVGAEIQRRHDEADRVQKESERVNNENTRILDENARIQNENARIQNENARIRNDEIRDIKISKIEDLIGDVEKTVDGILAIQESLIGGDA
jgi:hypothetical protein